MTNAKPQKTGNAASVPRSEAGRDGIERKTHHATND
jgi:hypothetical protein